MQQWFAAADRNDGGAHLAQAINALEHFFQRHGLREIVKLVAVGAGEIAAPYRNDVHQHGMARGDEALCEHAQLAQFAVRREQLFANFGACCHGCWRSGCRPGRAPDCASIIMPYSPRRSPADRLRVLKLRCAAAAVLEVSPTSPARRDPSDALSAFAAEPWRAALHRLRRCSLSRARAFSFR